MASSTNDLGKIQELVVELAVLDTKFHAAQDQLKQQAIEYERRLHELNNAHAKAEAVLHTYITRELFDRHTADLTSWKERIDKELSIQSGKNAMLLAIISFVMSFAALSIFFYNAIK